MMINRISKPIAWLQLILLFIAIFPRDVFHELQGCNDTIDCIRHHDDQQGLVISEQHHHCELMQLDSPHSYVQAQEFRFSVSAICLSEYNAEQEKTLITYTLPGSSRAPPFS